MSTHEQKNVSNVFTKITVTLHEGYLMSRVNNYDFVTRTVRRIQANNFGTQVLLHYCN